MKVKSIPNKNPIKPSSILPYPNIDILKINNNRTSTEHIVLLPSRQIDLSDSINTFHKKTIVHVFNSQYRNGFGDFLRGSIGLAQFAKHFKISFKIIITDHPIKQCLYESPNETIPTEKIHILYSENASTDLTMSYYMYSLLIQFMKTEQDTIYITTNLWYNNKLLTSDIKEYINSVFRFKDVYYDDIKKLNLPPYNVLHVRCLDHQFEGEVNCDSALNEIIKLQLDKNTIILSNNFLLKQKIHKLFGYSYINSSAVHTANATSHELYSSIQDYLILSKSMSTYCLSYYKHGSGFSEQCSALHNIPYSVRWMDFSIQSNHLLLQHYNNVLERHHIISPETTYDNYDHVSFITLTNTGYMKYTLNCIQSLKNCDMKKKLKVYCLGEEGCSILSAHHIEYEQIYNKEIEQFESFKQKNWASMMFQKLPIIYKNLLTHEYVCFTDGDIVYENNKVFDFLLSNIGDHDILIQSEGIDINDVCCGFMFIRSNTKTKHIFNPDHVIKYVTPDWDDQTHFNSIKHQLSYKKLPLTLFPSGKYYYTYHEQLQPYLIHFNWVIGHQKQNKMIHHRKWYPKKLHVCNTNKRDLFYQVEGTIRLLALHLCHQLTYVNVETDLYLKGAVQSIVSEENSSNVKEEYRPFQVVLQDDHVDSTVYQYDGVHYHNAHTQLPNMEIESFKSYLPTLRKAFRNGLPLPTYDRARINVVCHMDLYHDALKEIVQTFQKYNQYRIILYTKEKFVYPPNTIVYEDTSLQTFSDCIHADILLMSFSSLSIAAHLLADEKQHVVYTTDKDIYRHRLLNKCVHVKDL